MYESRPSLETRRLDDDHRVVGPSSPDSRNESTALGGSASKLLSPSSQSSTKSVVAMCPTTRWGRSEKYSVEGVIPCRERVFPSTRDALCGLHEHRLLGGELLDLLFVHHLNLSSGARTAGPPAIAHCRFDGLRPSGAGHPPGIADRECGPRGGGPHSKTTGRDQSRLIMAWTSISKSWYSSPLTSTTTCLIVPPVNAHGRRARVVVGYRRSAVAADVQALAAQRELAELGAPCP